MLHWQALDLEFEACGTRAEYTDLKVRLEQELAAVYGVAWLAPREAGNLPYPCFYRQADGAFAFTANGFSDDDWWHSMRGRPICHDRPMNSSGRLWICPICLRKVVKAPKPRGGAGRGQGRKMGDRPDRPSHCGKLMIANGANWRCKSCGVTIAK